jgi:hypothetical protein
MPPNMDTQNMPTRTRALVFAAAPARAARLGDLGPYDDASATYRVRLDDGTAVRAAPAAMFLEADIPRVFAPLERLAPLNDVAAVATGAHGRTVVATAPIPAGAVFKTRVLALAVPDDDAADIEQRMLAYVKRNLTDLMGLPKKHKQSVHFGVGTNDYMLFIRALALEAKAGNPVLAALMDFDFFSDDFLTQFWDRAAKQDLLWIKFWTLELQDLLPPPAVFRLVAFASGWAYPMPSPAHKHGLLLFGDLLSIFECPPARWAYIQEVVQGRRSAAHDPFRAEGAYHSSFLLHDAADGFVKCLAVAPVLPGQPLYLDYGPRYAAGRKHTVNDVGYLPHPENLVWLQLYMRVAADVSQRLANHLAAYINRNHPRILEQATHTDLPRCANAACAKPLRRPLFCSRCKAVPYCDRDCQTAAWRTHKTACTPAAGAK